MTILFRTFTVVSVFWLHSSLAHSNYLESPNQDIPLAWETNQKHIILMPGHYSEESRDINFCYAFTGATLINQMLYTINQPERFKPVSVMDLAVFGLGLGLEHLSLGEGIQTRPIFDDLGNEYRTLIYASLKKKLALEVCAPFDRLKILQSSNPKRDEDLMEFISILKAVFSEKESDSMMSFKKGSEQILSWEPRLGSLPVQIERALAENSFSLMEDVQRILGQVVVPDQCHKQGINLPSFEVTVAKFDPSNKNDVIPHIIRTIERDRPVSFPFCIDETTCKTQHVLVIFGWREICNSTSQNCQKQFLMRDSGIQVSERPGDYWVDESMITHKIEVVTNMFSELSSKEMAPNRILNLEYEL